MCTYYVDKTTGTAADTLLMAGVAEWLSLLYDHAGRGIPTLRIKDGGTCWQLHCDAYALNPAALEQPAFAERTPFYLRKLLVTHSQRTKLGDQLQYVFDYDAEQKKAATYREQQAALPPRFRVPGAIRQSDDPALQEQLDMVSAPSGDLALFAAINQMKIASSYNELVQRWRELMDKPRAFWQTMALLLRLFSETPNPTEAVVQDFAELAKRYQLGKTDATLLQIVNPTTGKGLNRPKADGLLLGSLSGCWLFELLKFGGFFTAALPQRIQNSDDRKTYVVRARMLHFGQLQEIMRDFRKVVWQNSPAKLDVLAALHLANLLIDNHRTVLQQLAEAERRRHRGTSHPPLTTFISGLDVTFYKSLGSAVATMNLSFVALPDWLPLPATLDKAQCYIARKPHLGLLTEHITIITKLDETKGEEEALLQHYRDFLSSRDPALTAFFAFTRGYATYVMRQLAKQGYVPLLSTNNLEVLMQARDEQYAERQPLAPLLKRDGFRNIARAIRESTIRAQYRVAQENDRRYEIAYGLGQELARSLHQRETFVVALMEFIRRYNGETAREEEKLAKNHGGKLTPEVRRNNRLRRLVETEDIEDFLAVLDEYDDHKLVGNLLLAYGYAFDSATRHMDEATLSDKPVSEPEGV